MTCVSRGSHRERRRRERGRWCAHRRESSALVPLLRLRQACNHPQAGTHGVRGLIKGGAARAAGILAGTHIGAGGRERRDHVHAPDHYLFCSSRSNAVEAEEAQRLVAFTRNASAGVACCEARFGAAVEHYARRLEAGGLRRGGRARATTRPAAAPARVAQPATREDAADRGGEEDVRGLAPSRALCATTPNPRRGDRAPEVPRVARRRRRRCLGAHAPDLRRGGIDARALRRRGAAIAAGPAGATWWAEALSLAQRDARDEGSGLFDRLVDGALQGSWQGERVAFTDLNGFRFALERDLEKLTTLRGARSWRTRPVRKNHRRRETGATSTRPAGAARAFWAAAKSATFSSTRKPRTRDVTTRRLRAVHAAERRP